MGLEGLIEHHAYIVTALLIFCACMGALLPVSLTLLVAGAALTEVASIRSCFYPQLGRRDWRRHSALPGVRFTGWWLLAGLCRLTTNPEQCIFRSADYFYRRGPHTLLFFQVRAGLGAMAAPLAGSLNMRLGRFLRLDAQRCDPLYIVLDTHWLSL